MHEVALQLHIQALQNQQEKDIQEKGVEEDREMMELRNKVRVLEQHLRIFQEDNSRLTAENDKQSQKILQLETKLEPLQKVENHVVALRRLFMRAVKKMLQQDRKNGELTSERKSMLHQLEEAGRNSLRSSSMLQEQLDQLNQERDSERQILKTLQENHRTLEDSYQEELSRRQRFEATVEDQRKLIKKSESQEIMFQHDIFELKVSLVASDILTFVICTGST